MRAIHPNLVPWFKAFNAAADRQAAAGVKLTPIAAREGLAATSRLYTTTVPNVAWVGEDCIPTPEYHVPVRIYHPAPDKALPVLIYYHGGGHVIGSVPVYDAVCRKLALATGHIVVAPEYRLVPECRYLDGVTDACNVSKYVWSALDNNKLRYERTLALAGDSAGGALAAIVSFRAQFDAGLIIKHQALIYPWVDYTMSFPSIELNGSGYTLPKNRITWFYDLCFARGENRKEFSPLYWETTPRMPQTMILTAEFCPLRDEGVAYADKLRAASIRTEHVHFDDMPHTFILLEDVVPDACTRLYAAIGNFLRS